MKNKIYDEAKELLTLLRERHFTIGSVESCTGGGFGAAITEIPGSSDVFMGGIIPYSNVLKSNLVAVPQELIAIHGAVSQEVAGSMAVNGAQILKTDIAVAITGIAGPDGGTFEKPVGLVFIAVVCHGKVKCQKFNFGKIHRTEIRQLTIFNALLFTKNSFIS